jgi:hypothetical protein
MWKRGIENDQPRLRFISEFAGRYARMHAREVASLSRFEPEPAPDFLKNRVVRLLSGAVLHEAADSGLRGVPVSTAILVHLPFFGSLLARR